MKRKRGFVFDWAAALVVFLGALLLGEALLLLGAWFGLLALELPWPWLDFTG